MTRGRQFAWTALTNIAALAAGLLTSTILARLLGPVGRGELAQIQTWPLLITGVAALGLPTATTYLTSRERSEAGRFFSTTLLILMLWAIPVCLVAYQLMPVLLHAAPPGVVTAARIYLLIIPIQFAIAVPSSVLQGLQAFGAWNILRLQGPVAWILAIAVAVLMYDATPQSISSTYLVVMAVVALVFITVVPRLIQGPFALTLAAVPRLLKFGIPAAAVVVPQQLNLRLDQGLMAALMPADVLGLYVVAVAWSGALAAPVAAAAGQVLFPWLASHKDPDAARAVLQSVFRLAVVGSVALSVLLIISTPVLLPLMFGPQFSPAIIPAIILIVAAAVTAVGQIAGESLRGLGSPGWPTGAECVGLVVTVSLLPWLLTRYGATGAAIASLLSYTTSFAVLVFALSRISASSLADLLVCRRSDLIALRERFLSSPVL